MPRRVPLRAVMLNATVRNVAGRSTYCRACQLDTDVSMFSECAVSAKSTMLAVSDADDTCRLQATYCHQLLATREPRRLPCCRISATPTHQAFPAWCQRLSPVMHSRRPRAGFRPASLLIRTGRCWRCREFAFVREGMPTGNGTTAITPNK